MAPLLDPARSCAATAEDAAYQLSRLLDFHGSVELGKPLQDVAATDSTHDAGQRVRQELADDLAEVRAQLAHSFSRWTAQKSRIADPERLAETLARRIPERSGGTINKNDSCRDQRARRPVSSDADLARVIPPERRTSVIADDVWTVITEEALKELTQARRAVRRLRLELEPSLVVRGPLAMRLCELNHTLSEALEPAVQARMERLFTAAQTHLVKELASSVGTVSALSDVVARGLVEHWLSHEGPIRQGIALLMKLAKAGLELEEQRLLRSCTRRANQTASTPR